MRLHPIDKLLEVHWIAIFQDVVDRNIWDGN